MTRYNQFFRDTRYTSVSSGTAPRSRAGLGEQRSAAGGRPPAPPGGKAAKAAASSDWWSDLCHVTVTARGLSAFARSLCSKPPGLTQVSSVLALKCFCVSHPPTTIFGAFFLHAPHS